MHLLYEVHLCMPNEGKKHRSDYELSGDTRLEKSLCHQKSERVVSLKKAIKNMDSYSLYYLLAINIVTFLLYGIDKYKAKKGRWRISEATLIALAVIGGSIGAWGGMHIWHHKTKHKKFKLGIPTIIILQIALAIYLRLLI